VCLYYLYDVIELQSGLIVLDALKIWQIVDWSRRRSSTSRSNDHGVVLFLNADDKL
jgi:hypothetical protein